MTSKSEGKTVPTPAEAVADVARILRKGATWDDAIRKITAKRIEYAEAGAKELDPENARQKLKVRLGSGSFLATVGAMMLIHVITLVNSSAPLTFAWKPCLFVILSDLFYGAAVSIIVTGSVEWFLTMRGLGYPKWSVIHKTLSIDESWAAGIGFLMVLLLLCLPLWLYFDLGKIAAVTASILFIFIFLIFVIDSKPVSVLYLGSSKQSNLNLHYRIKRRIAPARVISMLGTDLDGDLQRLWVELGGKYGSLNDLTKKAGRVASVSVSIVIDASIDQDMQENLSEVLHNTDKEKRYFIRVEDDTLEHGDALKMMMKNTLGIDPTISTDSLLMDQLGQI